MEVSQADTEGLSGVSPLYKTQLSHTTLTSPGVTDVYRTKSPNQQSSRRTYNFACWGSGKWCKHGYKDPCLFFVDGADITHKISVLITKKKSIIHVIFCLQFMDAGTQHDSSTPAGSPGWECVALKMQKHPVIPGFVVNHVPMYQYSKILGPQRSFVLFIFGKVSWNGLILRGERAVIFQKHECNITK